jgi:hypothetical protein
LITCTYCFSDCCPNIIQVDWNEVRRSKAEEKYYKQRDKASKDWNSYYDAKTSRGLARREKKATSSSAKKDASSARLDKVDRKIAGGHQYKATSGGCVVQ